MAAYFGAVFHLCGLLLISFIIISDASSGDWNTNDYFKREHSLVKPYQGSGADIPYWDFAGDLMVTSSYIRITPDLRSRAGSLWNRVPCRAENWELQVQFKVHGSGKDHLFGDGMAIWYTKERLEMGPVFGNKDYFQGLAVFLDTYSNHNGPHNHGHPYISSMVNNGSLHYDHDRDGTHTELAGCEAKFRNLDHDTYLAIRYERDTITVSTDIENKKGWKECFSVKGVRLPTGYYFGVSAATGDLSDTHDVISMKFYQLDINIDNVQSSEDRSNIVPEASFFASPRDHLEDVKPSSMSGLKLIVIILCATIGLVICVVISIVVFQKRQETTRKRFY